MPCYKKYLISQSYGMFMRKKAVHEEIKSLARKKLYLLMGEARFSKDADRLDELARHESLKVKEELAWNRDISESICRYLLYDAENNDKIIQRLGHNPNLRGEDLWHILNSGIEGIWSFVLINDNVSMKMIGHMVDHGDDSVRELIAGNPYIDADILLRLSKVKNEGILLRLCGNKGVTKEILLDLSKSEFESVRDKAMEFLPLRFGD